jgi:hypothetical protein
MTHREEQSMRRRIKSTHIADYALLAGGALTAVDQRIKSVLDILDFLRRR